MNVGIQIALSGFLVGAFVLLGLGAVNWAGYELMPGRLERAAVWVVVASVCVVPAGLLVWVWN